ncbi:hypothetical protein RJ640_007730 [Escallonia rubra]|uniref:Retrovirus-related Pol polyprotein from transposon RE1 n=1 Tax=Escallonia rubra TaxID=112253 RepID=A0AA88QL79_9ASTE|nr:hypothetical protein RJ640_007730 [Escallonia rubra]
MENHKVLTGMQDLEVKNYEAKCTTQSREDMSHGDVNSSNPKVFGCVSFIHVHSSGRSKLDPRAVKGVFIRYSPTQKGYKCYNPTTRKTYVSADVTFVEEESYFSSPYLQGETSSMEDKDLFLREPSMPINPTLTMPLKVYSRRIKPVINPVQVQETESSLGNEHSASGGVTTLIVYVDDIIVTGNDSDENEALRKYLPKEFEIKDLGKLKYFLGIEVARSKEGIFVSQQKYVLDLLEETGKLGCRPSDTPIEAEFMEGEPTDKGMYQRLVGKLICHTRGLILHTHPGRGILFRKGTNMELEAYTDADYAGSLTDRRSTSGYCTFLGGNLVTWKSKKQPTVARSSSEAEFRSMAQGICELLWLKIILKDLKIKLETPMKLYCDNKSAINIAHNPIQHDRTKHVEVD